MTKKKLNRAEKNRSYIESRYWDSKSLPKSRPKTLWLFLFSHSSPSFFPSFTPRITFTRRLYTHTHTHTCVSPCISVRIVFLKLIYSRRSSGNILNSRSILHCHPALVNRRIISLSRSNADRPNFSTPRWGEQNKKKTVLMFMTVFMTWHFFFRSRNQLLLGRVGVKYNFTRIYSTLEIEIYQKHTTPDYYTLLKKIIK